MFVETCFVVECTEKFQDTERVQLRTSGDKSLSSSRFEKITW